MRDKVFLDSNIIVYSVGIDKIKKGVSVDLLKQYPTISVQVINEVVNVCLKKLRMPKSQAFEIGRTLINNCKIVSLTESAVLKGFFLSEKYGFSYWDSLIVAAALENECSILYTEDLQHNQIIENHLLVKNPYVGRV